MGIGAIVMWTSGVGFVVGVKTLWGDVWAHVGFIMVNGGVLNRSITLGFEHKVVGRDSAALGVISLMNVAIVGLGGIGSSLGMVGALLDG